MAEFEKIQGIKKDKQYEYTYNGVTFTSDDADLSIFADKQSGEIYAQGMKSGSVKGSDKDDTIHFFDCSGLSVDLGKGNDNLNLYNGNIDSFTGGEGNDVLNLASDATVSNKNGIEEEGIVSDSEKISAQNLASTAASDTGSTQAASGSSSSVSNGLIQDYNLIPEDEEEDDGLDDVTASKLERAQKEYQELKKKAKQLQDKLDGLNEDSDDYQSKYNEYSGELKSVNRTMKNKQRLIAYLSNKKDDSSSDPIIKNYNNGIANSVGSISGTSATGAVGSTAGVNAVSAQYGTEWEQYGYNADAGSKLANAAIGKWTGVKTNGYCLSGVNDSLTAAGYNAQGYGSAYQAANGLANDSNFVEVTGLTKEQMHNLPAGAIVVWSQYDRDKDGQIGDSDGGQHGHIAITDGNDLWYSDGQDGLKYGYTEGGWGFNFGTQRVFIPVA